MKYVVRRVLYFLGYLWLCAAIGWWVPDMPWQFELVGLLTMIFSIIGLLVWCVESSFSGRVHDPIDWLLSRYVGGPK